MTSTIDSPRIAPSPDADANPPSGYPDTGLWPILKGVEEGWLILPKNPYSVASPADVAFTSEKSIEEALREVRGGF